ncbi:hypothetical protein CPB85DRAFT_1359633 [Mucidula mucida]|nr:hypothetical protein CPB85DRAFT_1359633 [Mucidula mucida]
MVLAHALSTLSIKAENKQRAGAKRRHQGSIKAVEVTAQRHPSTTATKDKHQLTTLPTPSKIMCTFVRFLKGFACGHYAVFECTQLDCRNDACHYSARHRRDGHNCAAMAIQNPPTMLEAVMRVASRDFKECNEQAAWIKVILGRAQWL